MIGRKRGGGAVQMQRLALEMAVKRQRELQEVEEDAPASIELNAHAELLTLLALVKSHFDTLVQSAVFFSFVRLPPRLPRPLAGAQAYGMSLTHAERLVAVGCGLKGKLVRLLSLGVGRHFEPPRRTCHKMMHSTVRWVCSQLLCQVAKEATKEGQRLYDDGSFQEAVDKWRQVAYLGHAHAQFKLGAMLRYGDGVAQDKAEAVRLYCLAAAQGHANAQFRFGSMLSTGDGVAQDIEEAVRFYYLAAAQGHATAQFRLGAMFSEGLFVAQDKAEAERFYRLAAAQGHATAQLYLNARKW